MTKQLRDQVLVEIGYETPHIGNCGNCSYRVTEDDPMLDRSWIEKCSLLKNTLGLFTIEKSAWCRFWKV